MWIGEIILNRSEEETFLPLVRGLGVIFFLEGVEQLTEVRVGDGAAGGEPPTPGTYDWDRGGGGPRPYGIGR